MNSAEGSRLTWRRLFEFMSTYGHVQGDFLIMSLQFGGQKKHGHAVNTQGVRSQKCSGESPRALGQRVPLGDQKAETLEQTAMLHAELWFWAFGPLQLQSYAVSICKNANRTGLTLFMLSFCSSATRGFSRGILLSSAMLTDV